MSEKELVAIGLVTYLVHGTALAAAAFALDRVLKKEALALRQALWRVALVGGLFTASLQLGLGLAPLSGSWTLLANPAAGPAPVDVPAVPRGDAIPAALAAAPLAPSLLASRSPWSIGLALWTIGAAAIALRFGLAHRRFRRSLASRVEIGEAPLRGRLDLLRNRGDVGFAVRLSSSPRLSVPVAFGLTHAEICVPARCLDELSAEQRDSLFAHELAHLVRRDPLWMLVDTAYCAIFFFQPLNWIVRRRLQALSELACDSWAIAATGDPVALAGCLTEVAGWTHSGATPVLAPAIGGMRSHLGQRVERLLDGSASTGDPRGHGRAWLLAIALSGAVAWLAPGISLADKQEADRDEEVAEEREVVTMDDEAPEAPEAPAAAPARPAKPARRGARALPPPPPGAPAIAPPPPTGSFPPPEGMTFEMPLPPPAGADRDVMYRYELLSEEDRRVLDEDMRHATEEARRDVERNGAQIRRHVEKIVREVVPSPQEMEKLRREIDETVRAAMNEARRDLANAAQELAREHRNLEEQRQALDEARRELEKERERLHERGATTPKEKE